MEQNRCPQKKNRIDLRRSRKKRRHNVLLRRKYSVPSRGGARYFRADIGEGTTTPPMPHRTASFGAALEELLGAKVRTEG